jgi:hypothetical protein
MGNIILKGILTSIIQTIKISQGLSSKIPSKVGPIKAFLHALDGIFGIDST